MESADESARIAADQARALAEYERRDGRCDLRYDPASPAVAIERAGRRIVAERLLKAASLLPDAASLALEVGCGAAGWAPDLLAWGAAPASLHGVDLSEARIARARIAFPYADLRIGNAAELPWPDGRFNLVVASTLFTSILDDAVRRRAAAEIVRVLAPGGGLLWYDFAVDNPLNPQVRKVTRAELTELYPTLRGEVARVTLAPPLARLVAPVSHALASGLARLPFLRTHLLAVLVKPL